MMVRGANLSHKGALVETAGYAIKGIARDHDLAECFSSSLPLGVNLTLAWAFHQPCFTANVSTILVELPMTSSRGRHCIEDT